MVVIRLRKLYLEYKLNKFFSLNISFTHLCDRSKILYYYIGQKKKEI